MSAPQRVPHRVYAFTSRGLGPRRGALLHRAPSHRRPSASSTSCCSWPWPRSPRTGRVPLTSSSSMSLSYTVHLAAGILFGPAVAGDRGADRRRRHRRHHPAPARRCASPSTSARWRLATMLAGSVYFLLGGSTELDLVADALPVIAASLVYLLVNNTLVSGVLGLIGTVVRPGVGSSRAATSCCRTCRWGRWAPSSRTPTSRRRGRSCTSSRWSSSSTTGSGCT